VKPPPFAYAAPESVTEAVALLHEHGDEARVLAGGQSLMPLLALRLARPAVVVDVNRVAELDYLRLSADLLVIGALARHRDVELEPGLARRSAMLAEAIEHIGHVAIRNRGTVCGSLAHADAAAEWPALVVALDGEIEAVSVRGRRTIPAADFFVTHLTTTLAADELVTEVRLPLSTARRTGSCFVELARRHGDFALCGVAAQLSLAADGTVADARIVLVAVADRPRRAAAAEAALLGEQPTAERVAAAAAAVDGGDLAPVLTRRALERARERARD
jgi:carbon-monoxide dehydrogenase medium subunit